MLSPEDAKKIQNKAIMKKRVPFSSENKFSAVTLNNGANDFTVYKGAPEKLIEKCKFYLDKAVAMEAGIYKPGDLAVTNDEFEATSDVKVKEIIPQLRVISRCSPNTKLRLVTLAQGRFYLNTLYSFFYSSIIITWTI